MYSIKSIYERFLPVGHVGKVIGFLHMQLQETGFQYFPAAKHAALAESSAQTHLHSCSMNICTGLHSSRLTLHPHEHDVCSSTSAVAHSDGVAPEVDEWRIMRISIERVVVVAGMQLWYLLVQDPPHLLTDTWLGAMCT